MTGVQTCAFRSQQGSGGAIVRRRHASRITVVLRKAAHSGPCVSASESPLPTSRIWSRSGSRDVQQACCTLSVQRELQAGACSASCRREHAARATGPCASASLGKTTMVVKSSKGHYFRQRESILRNNKSRWCGMRSQCPSRTSGKNMSKNHTTWYDLKNSKKWDQKMT